MNRWAQNFMDWVTETPSWLRNLVALVIAAIGLGICALGPRIGLRVGGKFGGALIGVGLALFAADLFIE
jgi:hypothetical protein